MLLRWVVVMIAKSIYKLENCCYDNNNECVITLRVAKMHIPLISPSWLQIWRFGGIILAANHSGVITNKSCLLRFSRNSDVTHAYQHNTPWHKVVLTIKSSITSLLQVKTISTTYIQ